MAGTLVSRFSIVLPGSVGSSMTAMLTAAARALHREEPPPWVLDDPVALELAGEQGADIRDRIRTELPRESLLAFVRWAIPPGG